MDAGNRPVTERAPTSITIQYHPPVATPTRQASFGPTDLLRSMLLIAPVILVSAGLVGYWLAGSSMRPVEGIMDEVDAISDGRSLHRRLAVPLSGDEMARLALTVNGMLARLEQSFAACAGSPPMRATSSRRR